MVKLTVLTTTYNRANLLSKCWESLCKQTCKDFEWLIIDDGSTDNTSTVVNSLKEKTSDFSIEYHWKENGGKHTALNFSHQYIHGEYLIMLDDDDILTSDAVETILFDWRKYGQNKKIGCISYQRANINTGKVLVDWESKEPVISNAIDFRINSRRSGDCAETIRTQMFKEFPAPIFDNEKFLPEDFLWVNSAFVYDTVYIQKKIYLCEYREDGLTKTKHRRRFRDPQGGMYTCNLYFNKRFAFEVQVKKAILYDAYAIEEGSLRINFKNSKNKFLCYGALPIAFLIALQLKKKNEVTLIDDK